MGDTEGCFMILPATQTSSVVLTVALKYLGDPTPSESTKLLSTAAQGGRQTCVFPALDTLDFKRAMFGISNFHKDPSQAYMAVKNTREPTGQVLCKPACLIDEFQLQISPLPSLFLALDVC